MPKPDALTLKQMRALRALHEHGSIAAAANALGLTPPAVHAQLRGLASALAVEPTQRTESGQLELTPAGRAVLAAAQRVEGEIGGLLREIRAQSEGFSGFVSIAVVSTGKYFAPSLVADVRHHYPDIAIDLKVGNRGQTIAAIENRNAQLAIMGRPPRYPAVDAVVLGPHPHVLVAPPGHPLAGRHVSKEELLDQTFIAREPGSGTRILMTRYLDHLGEGRVYDTLEMGSNETIKQAVMAGLGIALISRHTIVEELRAGRLVELIADGLPINRQWFLVHRSGEELSPAASRVYNYIVSRDGAFLPA